MYYLLVIQTYIFYRKCLPINIYNSNLILKLNNLIGKYMLLLILESDENRVSPIFK